MAFLAVLGAASVRADVELSGQRLDLRVRRGATCLDLELLSDELAAWLKDTTLPAGVVVEVVGSEHDPHTLTTRVFAGDGSVSERVFSPAPSFCPYLHQAVALTLSLSLKALASTPAEVSVPADAAVAEPVSPATLGAGPPPTPELPREPPSSASPVQIAVSAGAILAAGALGRPAAGGSFGLALVFRYVTVGGELVLLRSFRESLAPVDASYRSDFVGGRFGACGVRWMLRKRLALEACAEGLVGRSELRVWGAAEGGGDHVLWGVIPGLAVRTPILERRGYARFALGVASFYRALRVAALDEAGRAVAGQTYSRVAGVFTFSLGYGGGPGR